MLLSVPNAVHQRWRPVFTVAVLLVLFSIQRHGVAAAPHRLFRLARCRQHHAEMGMIRRRCRVAGDRLADSLFRQRMIATLIGDHAQPVQAVRMPRLKLQNTAIGSFGSVELPGMMRAGRRGEQALDRRAFSRARLRSLAPFLPIHAPLRFI